MVDTSVEIHRSKIKTDEFVEKFKKRLLLKTRPHTPRAKRKRCYDVTLSRQEGNTMRHLANAYS